MSDGGAGNINFDGGYVPLLVGQWYYATFVSDATTAYAYMNGGLIRSAADIDWRNLCTTVDVTIGKGFSSSVMNGKIDEVRISNTDRSADWVEAEHLFTKDSNRYTYGAEEGQWVFKNNATPADGAALSAALLAGSEAAESYEEANPTAANPAAVAAGQDGEWDFALYAPVATAGVTYYFRLVKSDGTALNTYTRYPQLLVNASGGGGGRVPRSSGSPSGYPAIY